ncbi:DUF397 domain-containing protein [Micromonospora sp. NPDC049101]
MVGQITLVDLGRASGIVGVRDSKDPTGPALDFEPVAWRAFVTEVTRRS